MVTAAGSAPAGVFVFVKAMLAVLIEVMVPVIIVFVKAVLTVLIEAMIPVIIVFVKAALMVFTKRWPLSLPSLWKRCCRCSSRFWLSSLSW